MNAMAPNHALQQTAGHDSFSGLQAHRCPAAAELGRYPFFLSFSSQSPISNLLLRIEL
jgi:hypothetical protein